MSDIQNDAPPSQQSASEERKRIRSDIEFPYSDLESAIELAQTIHAKAGSACEADELAVWMGQTASGGTFRTRVSAARIFGLIETNQGRVSLTQLGRDAIENLGAALWVSPARS